METGTYIQPNFESKYERVNLPTESFGTKEDVKKSREGSERTWLKGSLWGLVAARSHKSSGSAWGGH